MALSERFDEALLLAADLHRTQTRKGSEVPYLDHLLGVASLVIEHGGDEDEVIAALLHDAVEDQGGEPTLARIREAFGDRVADIVAGCTDAVTKPKPPWRARKEAYIAHVREAMPSVRFVSNADKLHNARAILNDYREHGEQLWQRFSTDMSGILWYYRSLADVFNETNDNALSRELDRVVGEIEALCKEE
ncbi:MAG TPA: HD domain-containing protein [Gammaproteobacteria bacterium]|nr:HD domain-containing protein [Gammaproteobacteria bacterium]